MRIPRLEFQLANKGITKSLEESEFSLTGESADRVLWITTPRQLPGWTIIYRSSHSKELTLKHLILKYIIQELNLNELLVFRMLLIDLNDEDYSTIELILSNHSKVKINLIAILDLISEYKFLELGEPLRFYNSFRPSMVINKLWSLIKKLPPKRYIGVGYKDHGTLSTAPSWKEQYVSDGEVDTKANLLKFRLRVLFNPLSRNPIHPGYFRLKSPRRTKQEHSK